MLAEATPTVVYASTWIQTGLLAGLGTSLSGILIWLALRLLGKVDKVQADVIAMNLDMVRNYRRKDDCAKPTECPQSREPVKNLTSSVSKLTTDLAVINDDVADIQKLAGGRTLQNA